MSDLKKILLNNVEITVGILLKNPYIAKSIEDGVLTKNDLETSAKKAIFKLAECDNVAIALETLVKELSKDFLRALPTSKTLH